RGFVHEGEVTADGRRLARIYAESDLVVAECLRRGEWRGLGRVAVRSRQNESGNESRNGHVMSE
ncbi:hypothetical protein, partial [Nocardia farcinica]|uniref:hypothetical protein n=1 Tax=Nocardia farcinica TaxID=37329 RepID=UPI002457E1C8